MPMRTQQAIQGNDGLVARLAQSVVANLTIGILGCFGRRYTGGRCGSRGPTEDISQDVVPSQSAALPARYAQPPRRGSQGHILVRRDRSRRCASLSLDRESPARVHLPDSGGAAQLARTTGVRSKHTLPCVPTNVVVSKVSGAPNRKVHRLERNRETLDGHCLARMLVGDNACL